MPMDWDLPQDADAVYENWGTPQQRAIRHATPDELAPFAKADGSMGPKVTAVSGYVRSRSKPAWIGAYRELKRRWRAKRDPVFRCSDRASGNRCTMPDATLDASYQAYNGSRSGKQDKAFTPHPAIK